jgi:hypothetical protein
MPSYIVTASTSVVLVDTSILTAGQAAIVLLSSQTHAGRTVTIRDSLGTLSSPQSIIVSTTNGIRFTDGTSSIVVSNPYASLTVASKDATTWNIINTFAFPLGQTVANVRSLTTSTITGGNAIIIGTISTQQIVTTFLVAASTSRIVGPLFASTLVVGSVDQASPPYQTNPGYSAYVLGNSYVSSNVFVGGNLNVGGTATFASTVNITNSLNVSNSLNVTGFTTFQGPVTMSGNGFIEAQSVRTQSTLNVIGLATFNSALLVNSSIQVGTTLTTNTVQTSSMQITGGTTGIIQFGTGPTIRAQGSNITITPAINTPSLSTSALTATLGISTSVLHVTSSINADGVTQFNLSSTAIINPNGSLTTGAIQTNTLQVANSIVANSFVASSFTTSSCSVQNSIQSLSPTSFVSTGTFIASTVNVNTISTGNLVINSINTPQIRVSTLRVSQSIICSPAVSTLTFTNATIDNSLGNIQTSSLNTSSLVASTITFQNGLFQTASPFIISAPVTTFQTAVTNAITTSTIQTSTLTTSKVTIGSAVAAGSLGPDFFYSTIGGPSTNILISGGPGNYLTPYYLSNVVPPAHDPTDPYTSYSYFQVDYKGNPPPAGTAIQYTANFFWGGQINSYLRIADGEGPNFYGADGRDQTITGVLNLSTFSVEGFLYGTSRFSVTFNYTYNSAATYIDSNAVVEFNSGRLNWNYSLNGTTIQNSLNDMTIRNVYYYGSLNFASDPRIKEDIHDANLKTCYDTIAAMPLRTYKYNADYCSTFQIGQEERLGFLATDLLPHFPKSVHESETVFPAMSTSLLTIDTGQVEMAHLGATKYIMAELERLEMLLEGLRY